ncbi:hypothetical protein KDA06_01385 [Candidatus Saccharibacteria bacterium]|jgi:hypothetical protein|nr:hypothetical protein [Candidatus Saccharibacteria bacterium]HPR08973.1 hypothetical protein [Candidatus Saccharibacteria bacterium]
MKRLHILTKPTKVADIAEIDDLGEDNKWLLQAEKLQIKKIRRFRQQLAS